MAWNLLLAASLAAPAVEVDVRPLVGPAVRGELAAVSSAEVRLRTAVGDKAFAVQELLSVTVRGEKPAGAGPTVWVELADGSELLASGYKTAGAAAAVRLLGHGDAQVPVSSIRSVRWSPQDGALASQWREIVAREAAGDVIVVRRTPAALDQWEGVLRDVGEEAVQFELDGERISIPRAKLEGVVYYHSKGPELARPICRVVDRFGAQWRARSLRLDDQRLHLTTAAGVPFQLPVGQIAQFDFSMGNVVYLSDLEPASVRWTPFFPSPAIQSKLARLFQPRRDGAFDGGKLLLGNTAYDKGLAVHSRTELVYRLADDFRRFRAVVGIDDRVREAGNVRLVISSDGKRLFEQTISGKQAPLELDLDITGAGRLTILVDFGEDLDIADHLNLCDARLTR